MELDVAREIAERGYTVLRGFLEPVVVDSVRTTASQIVDELAAERVASGAIPHAFRGEPFETRVIRLYERDYEHAPRQFRENLHRTGMYPLFFHPRLLDVVQGILGPEIRLYPNYTARPKLPEWKGTEVLWHQDAAYTESWTPGAPVSSMEMVNVWTPLVPATVHNGCMAFIPGTHRLGTVRHVDRQYYLEIAEEELAPRLAQAVSIECNPGDVVLFDNLLFHCGLPNHATTVRWSVDWRYQDARQPTHRPTKGHLARSSEHPREVVASAEDWARRSFV
jgi:phytanoyl-CoA hydroxylase